MLFQIFQHISLHFEGEPPARAKFRKEQLVFVGKFHFMLQPFYRVGHVGFMSEREVSYFGHDGEQGHFVQGGFVQVVGNLDVEMPVFVEHNFYFIRTEAEGVQPLPVHPGQEAAMPGHVFQFVFFQGHFGQLVYGVMQLLHEAVVVHRVISVFEAERAHGIGKQLGVGIRRGKLI